MRAKPVSALWSIVASIVFVALVLGVLLWFGVDEEVVRLLRWVEVQGAWSALLFVAIMAAVVVFLLPGVLFTAGAGFVFGVVEGSIYVVLGTTLGAVIAFLIARYSFGERAARFVTRRARLQVFSDELTPHGWKIVMLSRLIPFFPFKLSNYFFGLTRFSLKAFAGGTLLGVIPLSVHNVYLGSIAADITTAGLREGDRGALEWGLYLAGLAALILIALYLNRLARRALSAYTPASHNGER